MLSSADFFDSETQDNSSVYAAGYLGGGNGTLTVWLLPLFHFINLMLLANLFIYLFFNWPFSFVTSVKRCCGSKSMPLVLTENKYHTADSHKAKTVTWMMLKC